MVTVAHPQIEPAEYIALQTRAGWQMDIELIDGEAVVMPPTGDRASSVQGELFFALRHWQGDFADEGLLLQDVVVAFPGRACERPRNQERAVCALGRAGSVACEPGRRDRHTGADEWERRSAVRRGG